MIFGRAGTVTCNYWVLPFVQLTNNNTMATCKTCGAYYKLTPYNQTQECDDCLDAIPGIFDSVYEADVIQLTNPSGRTLPVFQQEGYEE